MATFKDRIELAYRIEFDRRQSAGLPRLTKTELWKAAGVESSAVSHWFMGRNAADLDACLKIAKTLRCDGFWLFDESGQAPGEISANIKMSAVVPIPTSEHPDITAVVDLMRQMCPAQRGEVLGYARRVAETAQAASKANGAR